MSAVAATNEPTFFQTNAPLYDLPIFLPPISYKATIIQHMPELKTVGSIGAAAKSCGSITAEAADAAPDAFEADAAPPASAAVHIPLTDQPITAHIEDATSSAAATVAGAAAGDGGELE